MKSPRHGVVLLAAGMSRRLGRAKQLVEIDGETLVHRAARLALATQPHGALIVLGHGAEDVAAAVGELPLHRVICAEHARGMGASLAAGLAALHADCDGALVLLCDQPWLGENHLRALVDAWRRAPARACASAYADTLGVPALLPRAWFAQIDANGDRGARELLRAQREHVEAIPCEALSFDIDTPRQLDAVQTNAANGT